MGSRRLGLLVLGTAVLGASRAVVACGDSDEVVGDLSTARSAITASDAEFGAAESGGVEFALDLPLGLTVEDVALGAADGVRISNGSSVLEPGGEGAVLVNLGQQSSYLGVGARVGELWSGAPIELSQASVVERTARSARAITQQTGVSIGDAQPWTPLPELERTPWVVQLPDGERASGMVEPGQSRVLAPGAYDYAHVKQGATLSLSSGTYSLLELIIESGATLRVDDSAGPVVVVVQGNVFHRGVIRASDDPARSDLGLVVATTGGSVGLEARFLGMVVAPHAHVMVKGGFPQPHVGSVFGRTVHVEPNATWIHRPFDWGTLFGPTEVEWGDAPVKLVPVLTHGSDPADGDDGEGAGGSGDDGSSGDDGATGEAGAAHQPTPTRPGYAGGEPSAATTTSQPTAVELPAYIPVTNGNAGNGLTRLTLGAADGSTVVCNYRGGATLEHPTDDLEFARGLRYVFESCSDGHQPGESIEGTSFALEIVSGDPLHPAGTTEVELTLGEGECEGFLDPPMFAEEVVAIRDAFTWQASLSLPEVDADGRPTLFYGYFFIERREQLEALDRFGVMWSGIPLFREDIQKYDGSCGRVQHAFDGRTGVLVNAILPGKLYNMVRMAGIHAEEHNIAAPFRLIYLPQVPPSVPINGDGSLSYQALADSGFSLWLERRLEAQPCCGFLKSAWKATKNLAGSSWEATVDGYDWVDEEVIDPIFDSAEDGLGYAGGAWGEFVTWAATETDELWEGVQQGMFSIVDWAGADTVDYKVRFTVLNRDLLFGRSSPMQQGWGRDAGRYVVPHGAQLRFRQWFYVLPVMNEKPMAKAPTPSQAADPNSDYPGQWVSETTIPVLKDHGFRGDYALCLELENSRGMFTTDLIPNEVCDFRGAPHHRPQRDMEVDIRASERDVHAFSVLTEAADYMDTVIGTEPEPAEVLIGSVANVIMSVQGSDGVPQTNCLGFPGVAAGLSTAAATALEGLAAAGLGYLSGPIINKDIYWPSTQAADIRLNSRGVMTHEYGHYGKCVLLFEAGDASALTPQLGRMLHTDNDESWIAVTDEATAEAYAMQVVGGTTYFRSAGATDENVWQDALNYCSVADPANPPLCLETNYKGLGTLIDGAYEAEIAHVASLIHDAFDTSATRGSGPATDRPSNGDLWQQFGVQPTPSDLRTDASLVRPATSGFIGVLDETVQLGGGGWRDWTRHWLDGHSWGLHPVAVVDGAYVPRWDVADASYDVLSGLADAIYDAGYDWCQVCELFALHDPNFAGTNSGSNGELLDFSSRTERWEACLTGSLYRRSILDSIGAPPRMDLQMDRGCHACEEREVLDPVTGLCTPCGAREIIEALQCKACPAGTVADHDSNQCVSCGAGAIVVGNHCESCGVGYYANASTGFCGLCPADATIDLGAIDLGECGGSAAVELTGATGDVALCPDYWVEVKGLAAHAARYPGDGIDLYGTPGVGSYFEDLAAGTCEAHGATLELFEADLISPWSLVDQYGYWGQPMLEPLTYEKCVATGSLHRDGALLGSVYDDPLRLRLTVAPGTLPGGARLSGTVTVQSKPCGPDGAN